MIHCGLVSDIWASFTADPFLFFPNGSRGDWYALFEVKDVVLGRGVIGAAVSVDQVAPKLNIFNSSFTISFLSAGTQLALLTDSSY